MVQKDMKVMKFGGASVANGKLMLHVAQLVKNAKKGGAVVVVVSAIKGATDGLISVFQKYQQGLFSKAFDELNHLYHTHLKALKQLGLPQPQYSEIENKLVKRFDDLSFYLTQNTEHLSTFHYDYVISFGERFSSLLLAGALAKLGLKAETVDSANIIVTTSKFSKAKALLEETRVRARRVLLPLLSADVVPVVTGFFGATKHGTVATMGRGGSDYSATILAYVLDAQEVILWKDVDGIYTYDSKRKTGATLVEELSYQEARRLAKDGVKIIHPRSIDPIISSSIYLWIKNIFKPKLTGTKIWKGNGNSL